MNCQRIRVRGLVQGVGYRPFVWRLASELALAGWVRNDAEGVEIEAYGDAAQIAALLDRLRREAPPLARVDEVSARPVVAGHAAVGFSVIDSGAGGGRTAIGADTAVCADCLAEIFTAGDRRYRYAFTTCTHCGPRYTIAAALPYDRARTSLAPFPLCAECAAEYTNPADRRFHAEATCCPNCGPQLAFLDAADMRANSGNGASDRLPPLQGEGWGGDGESVITPSCKQRPHPPPNLPLAPVRVSPSKGGGTRSSKLEPEPRANEGLGEGADPIAATLRRLRRGEILAIKGLGGFHLVCDARNADAVARLRARKQREEKPFAVMAANAESLAAWVDLNAADRALLESPQRPIVLLPKTPAADVDLPGIAPGVAWLGALLPYTPLHYLLFHEAAGRPAGSDWLAKPQDLLLVMTSANPNGEPLVIGNDEARDRLAGIADAFLMHDRDIVARCDDSVLRGVPGGFQFVRRGRGYTPTAIRLPHAGPSVLACGGWYKNTICVTRGDEAFVSTHIGDLDNAATCDFLAETVARMLDLTEVVPEIVAHDRHPDFHSSRLAAAFAAERGLPAVAVQHHHAHIAAVCAEHGVTQAVLGLALDGIGLGDDDGAWGGELLRIDGRTCERLGHLAPLALPGGDRAAREPWRMAAAALARLGRGAEIAQRFADQPGAATVMTMLDRGLNCPPTSSLGRSFDAAAGLLGVRRTMAYEGQAAMLLEGLAAQHGPVPALAGGWRLDGGVLDLAPLFAELTEFDDAGRGAALFHATLAAALADWAIAAARQHGIERIVGAGGCWLNHVLAGALRRDFAAAGLTLLEARQLPPNDGGIALGQAWVAMNLHAE